MKRIFLILIIFYSSFSYSNENAVYFKGDVPFIHGINGINCFVGNYFTLKTIKYVMEGRGECENITSSETHLINGSYQRLYLHDTEILSDINDALYLQFLIGYINPADNPVVEFITTISAFGYFYKTDKICSSGNVNKLTGDCLDHTCDKFGAYKEYKANNSPALTKYLCDSTSQCVYSANSAVIDLFDDYGYFSRFYDPMGLSCTEFDNLYPSQNLTDDSELNDADGDGDGDGEGDIDFDLTKPNPEFTPTETDSNNNYVPISPNKPNSRENIGDVVMSIDEMNNSLIDGFNNMGDFLDDANSTNESLLTGIGNEISEQTQQDFEIGQSIVSGLNTINDSINNIESSDSNVDLSGLVGSVIAEDNCENFVCNGIASNCYIAEMLYYQSCKAEIDEENELEIIDNNFAELDASVQELHDDVKTSFDDRFGEDGRIKDFHIDGGSFEELFFTVDETNGFNFPRECPTPKSYGDGLFKFTIDLSLICQNLIFLRYLFMAIACVLSFFNFVKYM